MGYIKTDLLTLPSDSNYWVRMKQRMPTGDWLAATDYWRSYPLPPEGAKGSPEAAARVLAEEQRELGLAKVVMARVIVEWNVTDADEKTLPLAPESFDEIIREDFAFLRNKAEAMMAGRPVEAEAPFGNGSGKRSTATKTSKRRRS